MNNCLNLSVAAMFGLSNTIRSKLKVSSTLTESFSFFFPVVTSIVLENSAKSSHAISTGINSMKLWQYHCLRVTLPIWQT